MFNMMAATSKYRIHYFPKTDPLAGLTRPFVLYRPKKARDTSVPILQLLREPKQCQNNVLSRGHLYQITVQSHFTAK